MVEFFPIDIVPEHPGKSGIIQRLSYRLTTPILVANIGS